ncbi:YdcF family protein [Thermophagus sp. OGC60D27]|uniref:YdcF family protein n=1 Tax=Thermophagus sp. OGC60D27 TaxID=3458415 RepID=UPI004037FBC8
MFYLLSKIFHVFLSPVVWIVGLLLVGLFLKKRMKHRVYVAAILLFLIFSNGAFFHFVAGFWETRPKKLSALDGVSRTVVVLGGMASENRYNGKPRFMQSSDRLWQGLLLLKTGYADTLIYSGGRGTLFDHQRSEGELVKDYLADIGLLSERIIIESTSRNTYENAVHTREVIRQRGMSNKIILVTSAFHMPRARACFQGQGFDVSTFPADPLTGVRPLQWNDYLLPSAGVLERWGVLFREWVGFVMYKLNGYLGE